MIISSLMVYTIPIENNKTITRESAAIQDRKPPPTTRGRAEICGTTKGGYERRRPAKRPWGDCSDRNRDMLTQGLFVFTFLKTMFVHTRIFKDTHVGKFAHSFCFMIQNRPRVNANIRAIDRHTYRLLSFSKRSGYLGKSTELNQSTWMYNFYIVFQTNRNNVS